MTDKFKQPSGVRDTLPAECAAKRAIEQKLLSKFGQYGYLQIDTPALEYGGLYSEGDRFDLDRLFKFSDCDGALLVLRPDMTMPISRVVATKFAPGRYKLCYLGSTYRLTRRSNGLREFTQAGVEYMGASGTACDAEAVALAIESLLACGLDDFIIDIGHVGFFGGILKQLGLDEAKRRELAALVERKDVIGESLFAAREGLTSESMSLLAGLPMLFGDGSVLERARDLCLNDEMKRAQRRARQSRLRRPHQLRPLPCRRDVLLQRACVQRALRGGRLVRAQRRQIRQALRRVRQERAFGRVCDRGRQAGRRAPCK